MAIVRGSGMITIAIGPRDQGSFNIYAIAKPLEIMAKTTNKSYNLSFNPFYKKILHLLFT